MEHNTLTDQELATALKQRDEGAFDIFYDRYFDAVYKFCFFRLGRRSIDAEDVVSEVMITAMQKVDGLQTDEGTKIYNWLVTIARFKLLEHYRRKKQQDKEKLFSAFDENFERLIEDDADESEEAEGQQGWSCDTIGVVMNSLPQDYQRVLTEKYLNGCSVRQIASMMDRTEKAVESLLTRSRNSFKKAANKLGNISPIELGI